MVSIKNFTPRLYQETIMASCAKSNCLIILPTGLGKTKTAILAAAQRLNSYPNSKILFLTVTKPLAEQINNEIKECIDIDEQKVILFTGSVPPKKREEMWKDAIITVSTPQCIENDLINGRIDFENVSLIVADEAHNAVKDYSYTWLINQYNKKSRFPRIIGLTASPGSDIDRIKEVCKNLFIEEIEIRTDKDPDVKPYIQEIEMEWVKVSLSSLFFEVQTFIKNFLKERIEKLKSWGFLHRTDLTYITKTDLLELQAKLRAEALNRKNDFAYWNGVSLLAEIMKMYHALELLETQGVVALFKYMEKLVQESFTSKVKAVKNVVKDLNFRSAMIKVQKMYEEKVEHPKLVELQKIVEKEIQNDNRVKIIVFNQYRDNALDIVEKLNKIENIKAKIFVGQLKKGETGLTQKEQKKILDEFREGIFDVLVATSIGEQGLDIPQVNLVIFYEPIPSAIRHIQRRGRTGRHDRGRVIILMTEKTRDEGYRWAAHHKEKMMFRNLENIKRKIKLDNFQEKKITQFINESNIKIFADFREKSSGVIKELSNMNVKLRIEKLDNADYLLSSRVGVELKSVQDFVQSLIDNRIIEQIKNLKSKFERPLVVVEGEEDIYSVRNVHPNAIRGILATIAVSYGVPILYTKSSNETALLLYLIAKREQEQDNSFNLHGNKKPLSLKDMQEYIVSSLPGVGITLARPLLKEFKSIKNIVTAQVNDLEKVENIGPKKAKRIYDIVNRIYQTLE